MWSPFKHFRKQSWCRNFVCRAANRLSTVRHRPRMCTVKSLLRSSRKTKTLSFAPEWEFVGVCFTARRSQWMWSPWAARNHRAQQQQQQQKQTVKPRHNAAAMRKLTISEHKQKAHGSRRAWGQFKQWNKRLTVIGQIRSSRCIQSRLIRTACWEAKKRISNTDL